MEITEETYDSLRQCLIKHCPRKAKEDELAFPKHPEFILGPGVNYILKMAKYDRAASGVQDGMKSLNALLQTIEILQRQIDSMSERNKFELNKLIIRGPSDPSTDTELHLAKKPQDAPKGSISVNLVTPSSKGPPLFDARVMEIESLRQGVQRLIERQKMRRPSTTNDYSSASVAVACKRIWQLETGDLETTKYIHGNRLNRQPMERFIADVFKILKINSQVSSALNRVEKMGGDDAFLGPYNF